MNLRAAKETLSSDLKNSSNSGAKISVIERDKNLYVKKTAFKDIERFKKSFEKQKNFVPKDNIYAVDIVIKESSNKVEGLMPYTKGIVGEGYSKKATASEINNIANSLQRYFKFLEESSVVSEFSPEIINDKINYTLENCTNNNFISDNLREMSKDIANLIYIKEKKILIPLSECHGDFTMSNMIYTNENKLHLIDFLDTFVNSFLLDYAKIVQDTIFCWSVRNSDRNTILKHRIIGEKIMNKIFISHYKITQTLIRLNILRIVPYCNDKATEEWLKITLKKILK